MASLAGAIFLPQPLPLLTLLLPPLIISPLCFPPSFSFCSSSPNSLLFSLLFAYQPHIPQEHSSCFLFCFAFHFFPLLWLGFPPVIHSLLHSICVPIAIPTLSHGEVPFSACREQGIVFITPRSFRHSCM